jgi:hypothetical protein
MHIINNVLLNMHGTDMKVKITVNLMKILSTNVVKCLEKRVKIFHSEAT